MSAPPGGCLSLVEVERIAAGDSVAPEAVAHLAACESCRARVDEARNEASFVARARSLTRAALGPEGSPRLPGYQTLGILSSGAQGVVYRARQESTSRTVAIKTLIAGDAATARQRMRAEREAEIAARLRHANIVTVFESRTLADGRIAVVMEFVDGVPLDSWKPPGVTPAERRLAILRVFIDVCKAIHHAHLNGVIHRDLKPDNILVTADGRPVVLDFGIAAAPGIRTTQTGEFAGTPAYASPEQVSGKPDEVDGLTDVYSLGVILYRLLCGEMPYELDGSLFDIARIITEADPAPPRSRDSSIPPDLEAIVLRALAKDKHRRYQSAASFARDIERYLDGAPVEARSGSGWYLLRKAVLVNRARLALAAAIILLLLSAGVAVVWSTKSAADSARLADIEKQQARAESVRARAVTELLREALPNVDSGTSDVGWIYTAGLGRLYYRLESGAFADDPDLDQMLRRMWGSVYTDFGSAKSLVLVEYAEVALRSGLIKLRLTHGESHPEIAATLHELAGVVLVRGRPAEAAETCREALQMREKLFGPDALNAADSRALLARALLELGQTDDALIHAHRAMQVFSALPDPEADLRIGSMSLLEARVWIARSRPDRAEPPLREALSRRLRRLPPEDIDLLTALASAADFAALAPDAQLTHTLAGAWQCQPTEVAAAIRRDLPRFRILDFGDSCTPVATGRTAALDHLLKLQVALFGQNDPALVRVLIAQMQAAGGEQLHDIKIASALHAADILSATRGEMDRSVLACIEEAAVVLAYSGRADEAVELTRRAQRIHELPPEPLWDVLMVSNSRRHLAWFLSLAGRHHEAIPEFRRAIRDLTNALGPDHHVVALSEAGLAVALLGDGQLPDADFHSDHALAIARNSRIAVGDQLAHVCFARAKVLLARGDWSAAKALFEEAWSRFYRCAPVAFPWRIQTADAIAQCLDELGDSEAVTLWRSHAAGAPSPSPLPASTTGTP